MIQKQVKIIGLELKKDLGILKAHLLKFDKDNRLTIFKGSVGAGKTTEQKALQLGTQGSKTLVDNNLYGEIDTEVQLLDGEKSVWVGCKKVGKSLNYTIYQKDEEGNIIKNPVIDGIKATPSKYLQLLQTDLTWNMDELCSENPTLHRNILMKLYQHGLRKEGVIFDKKDPEYKNSILGKIDAAEKDRDYRDSVRKQLGGIADDLKALKVDPDKPHTVPDEVDMMLIDAEIKKIEREKTIKETSADSEKDAELADIKQQASDITNKLLSINNDRDVEWRDKKKAQEAFESRNKSINDDFYTIAEKLKGLVLLKQINATVAENCIKTIYENLLFEKIETIPPPNLYKINEDGHILPGQDEELDQLRTKYNNVAAKDCTPNLSSYDEKLQELEQKKKDAIETNKIVKAVDSFHDWRKANEEVVKLKGEYIQMLAKVDTGIDGLKIVPEDENIFLMYNGIYDPEYFGNKEQELRKLSSYSGTQKPMICLLIQNYLLSKKPKAMRYMYIDNIPMDKKTQELIKDMCEKLDLSVFLTITGDFSKDSLKDGEILIEGGEVFFNE